MQKSDGAAVPDHLWIHTFLQGYGQEACLEQHLSALSLPVQALAGHLRDDLPPSNGIGWALSLIGFCCLGLRWWRRNLLRGFHIWRRANVRINKGCTPSQMIQHTIASWDNQSAVVYLWSTKGRTAYRAQWLFLCSSPDGLVTVRAGLDAISRSANASWFEWLEGSAPFFWNWGERYQRLICDRQPHYTTGPFLPFLKSQQRHRDLVKQELMQEKVVQVRKRSYILPGKITEGTQFFCIDKGLDDICMVYTGTSCGLNKFLWAPMFGLPTVKQTLRALLPGYYQCNFDGGEQFLNYPLHMDLREYSGVDVSGVGSSNPADANWEADRGPGPWERWERNWMGLQDSPYCSLQWQVRLKFEVYGDRRHQSNPFHWDRVVFNLPGSKGYRSALPWVIKLRTDGHLAAEIFVYVGDRRTAGHSPGLTWRTVRAYGLGCSRWGIQDASRKRTSPTETPGPWAGTITHTEGGSVVGMVSQEKWDKTRWMIEELLEMIPKGPLPL